jgi:predicted permease
MCTCVFFFLPLQLFSTITNSKQAETEGVLLLLLLLWWWWVVAGGN